MIAGRAAVVAAMLGLLAPAGAVAAEQVVVRATEHARDHFGRIAFIWPAPVRSQARLDGTTLTVHFARPMTAKLDTIPKRLHRYVSSVRMRDSATVVARVTRGATLTSFTSGNTVAVDIALRHRRRADADDASDVAAVVPPPADESAAAAPTPAARVSEMQSFMSGLKEQFAKDRTSRTN